MKIRGIITIVITFAVAILCGCSSVSGTDNSSQVSYQKVEMEDASFEVPDTFTSEVTEYAGITEAQINSVDMSESPVSVTTQNNPAKSSPEQIMAQEETAKVERSGATNWTCKKINSVKIGDAECVIYDYSWNDSASNAEKQVYRAVITNDDIHIDIQSKSYAGLQPSSDVVDHIVASMNIN